MEQPVDGDSSPFWSQRRRRNPPSSFFNPVVVILAVPILFLILLFFILPPFVSHANTLIRPNSVKKSWDYFNIVLVLFAVLCGVFARRNDEASAEEGVVMRQNSVDSVSNFVSEPRHAVVNWLEYPDRKEYVNVGAVESSGGLRLRRSSSSYPDLRNESLWESRNGNGLRFHDDFEVNFYQSREIGDSYLQNRQIEREIGSSYLQNRQIEREIGHSYSQNRQIEREIESSYSHRPAQIETDEVKNSYTHRPEIEIDEVKNSYTQWPPIEIDEAKSSYSQWPQNEIDEAKSSYSQWPPRVENDDDEVKEEEVRSVVTSPVREIPVDKFEVSSAPPPEEVPETAPPPPPPAAAPVKKRRSHRSVPRRARKQAQVEVHEEPQIIEAPPPPVEVEAEPEAEPEPEQEPEPQPEPQPEPEPEPEFQFPDVISETVPKKRSGVNVKKEFATAIASLYKGQKRKKKKKVKSRDIYENALENTSSPPPSAVPEPESTAAPPPPPPPPPPLEMLQNLFKKGIKTKRVHSVPTAAPTGAPPPPPPPPPPNSIFNNLFKTGSKSNRFGSSSHSPPSDPPPAPPPPPSSILNSIFKTGSISRRFKHPPPAPPPPPSESRRSFGRPPKPPRPTNQYAESAIYAPASPLIPMPPPPPPFRMPEPKFVSRGDFVRIQSASSSMCSSPERDDFDTSSVRSDGQDLTGSSVACPSPDVNAKADNFIARLRDEWRLEKMSSMKEKRVIG